MDISAMLVGKSDQLDNVDLLSGPRDFTITEIGRGNAEQPLSITLAEFPRPWRPGLTMRRLLAAIWGPDASVYVGRRVRLYRDENVSFGNDKTGGTRISHASHIDKRVTVSLPKSKGKFAAFTVEPLPDAPAPSPTLSPDQIAASTDVTWLREQWKTAGPQQRERIQQRVAELTPPDDAA
ncbi:hypothetical protein MHY85_05270 [Cellulomonas sp. ACRRI]|uniref:hypothetical protein n=1 Tax=Cellulomonas sp. ACRRI TaxID=2918188 RepID=UPI001EF388A4|nr:hypothetical protein [Cellulomonas sp. ACRRI]MCG7285386.1 hypothetical protein [Cellulomonas sp. ACRRI]